MANLTTVTLTNGGGTGGSGTVSTLDNLIGTAGTSSAQVQTVQGIASMTPVQVSQATAANLNATVSGTVSINAIPAGTNVIGSVKATDGTNTAAVKAASTAAAATDPALVVAISPNNTVKNADGSGNLLTSTGNALDINIKSGVNANGRAVPGSSAPVVQASQKYQAVAASQTGTALVGAGAGAAGDWLDFILIVPATTAAGAVSIKDGAGSAITIWAGGATTALVSLVPFAVPIKAISAAGAWSVTTGTNVSIIAVGNFT